MGRRDKVLALCSGGFDSIVLLNHIKYNITHDVDVIFFNYNQKNLVKERECTEKICKKLNFNMTEISLVLPENNSSLMNKNNNEVDSKNQYVPMRNLIFLSYALSYAEGKNINTIYCAFIDPEDEYYKDTSPEFVSWLNDFAKKSGIKIETPYIDWTKNDLATEARFYQIRREDFFSCNIPTDDLQPCGKCGDCLGIEDIYNNYVEPNRVLDSYFDFTNEERFFDDFKNSPIETAKLFINNRCNFSCKHCFLGDLKKPEMKEEDVFKVIDILAENNIKFIDFFGKEPLVDSSVFTYVEYLKNKYPHINYGMITNGLNIDTYKDSIVKYFEEITVSIETTGKTTSRPYTQKIKDNISSLIKAGVRVEISLDLMMSNADSITDILEDLNSIGVNTFYVKPIFKIGATADNNLVMGDKLIEVLEKLNTFTENHESISMMFEMKESHMVSLRNNDTFSYDILDNVYYTREQMYKNVFLDLEFYCNRFEHTITITPDGYVLGCGYEMGSKDYSYLSTGNILTTPFKEIIEKGKESQIKILKQNSKIGCYFA